MSDTLQKICAQTRIDLEKRRQALSLDSLKDALKGQNDTPRGFIKSLKNKTAHGIPALIAEIKKASPSKGLIRADFDPPSLAKAYYNAGAACLSVLTDVPFFQGDNVYLQGARSACPLPALRKDFMIDPYQIYEARALGADCILLIVAALDDTLMQSLYTLSKDLGMDVLVEVHNEEELERALKLNAEMIGVNNRNLKTLEVSIETSHRLSAMMPKECLRVAESGIYSNAEIKDLQRSGFNAFLVGESLMRQDDVELATKTLLGFAA